MDNEDVEDGKKNLTAGAPPPPPPPPPPPCFGLLAGERAKWALLAYALAMTTLVGGVVYGWPSLRAVFIEEGVLSSECRSASSSQASSSPTSSDESSSSEFSSSECPEQAKSLGVVFACGAWSVQACRMVTGMTRDRHGTRVTVVGVMLLVAVGIVFLALAPPDSLALFSVGYFLLGVGAGVQLCMQSVSTLFGKYQGTASAALSGAFTASAAVPLVCVETIRALVSGGSYSHRDARLAVMLVYAGAVVLSAASALWLMPRSGNFNEVMAFLMGGGSGGGGGGGGGGDGGGGGGDGGGGGSGDGGGDGPGGGDGDEEEAGVKDGGEDDDDAVRDDDVRMVVAMVTSSEEEQEKRAGGGGGGGKEEESDGMKKQRQPSPAPAPPPQQAPHDGKTAWNQLMSLDFIFLASWFTVILLPTNFFIISIGDQLEDMGDDDRSMTTGFALVWVLSTLASPLAGFSADVVGRGPTMTFAMACYGASFALLGVSGDRGGGDGSGSGGGVSLEAQWLTFVVFNVGRLWVFSMYFVSIGRLFGFAHFGTLAGTGLLMSAMSTPLAVPMLRDGVDNGWGRSNAACVVICAACVSFTAGWTWRREVADARRRRR